MLGPRSVLAFQLLSPVTLGKTFYPTGALFSHLSLRIFLSGQTLRVVGQEKDIMDVKGL